MSRDTTKRLAEDHYKSKYPGYSGERWNQETFYGLLPYKHGTTRQEVQKYVKKAWVECT